MLRVHAQHYLALGAEINEIRVLLQMAQTDKKPLSAKEVDAARRMLYRVHKLCEQLEMPVSTELISKAIGSPPQTPREMAIYIESLEAELRSKLFFFIPNERAKHYARGLDENLQMRFPTAVAEIKRAGNCFALSEYTATVFHSMRAAEIALKAMGTDLQISLDPEVAQWKNVLDQIDAKVRGFGDLPKSQARDQKMQFYGAAAAQFRYFKDAWRNYVSHARATYDEGQALTVMNHSEELITTISSKLSEYRATFPPASTSQPSS
jgi:hypothetical protein